MIVEVTDPADPRLEDYFHLKDVTLRRRIEPERGLFMAESAEVIERAMNAGCQARSFLMTSRWLGRLSAHIEAAGDAVPVFLGLPEVLRAVTGFNVHRGAIAAMTRPALPPLASVIAGARRLAVLEDIVDHTNVGAIIRGAAGLGVDGVVVSPSCADPLYRRSVRVSMGTVFQVPWTRLEPWPSGLSTLRESGFTIAALTLAEHAITLDDFAAELPVDARIALLLGTEGDGLTSQLEHMADSAVRISMSAGVDSLNVAAAAAVAFWATRPR